MPQAVIASRLRDGRAVFLDRNGRWVEFIQDSRIAQSEPEGEEMMESARRSEERQEIVDPYLIDVVVDGGAVRPVLNREIIRAAGPTIRTDLGRQAKR